MAEKNVNLKPKIVYIKIKKYKMGRLSRYHNKLP